MPDPQIYKTLESSDNQTGRKTDLLLICGDFQVLSLLATLKPS